MILLERESVRSGRARFWRLKIESAFIKVIIGARKYTKVAL